MARSTIAAHITNQSKLKPQIEGTYRLVYYDTASNNERLSGPLKCQLQEIVNQVNTAETISECEKLISDRINDDIVLIINCSNPHDTEEIINRVSHYQHISTIYVINHHHHRYETLDISKYSKVINIQIEDFVSQFAAYQIHRQRYYTPGVGFRDQSTNSISETFGLLQCINDVTRRVGYPFPDTSEKFVLAWREHCSGNNTMLRKVATFEREYTAEKALWWYTNEYFIYDTVNKALRTLNFSTLQLFTFFIRDIHIQLSHLYQSSTRKGIIHLYRGQGMSRIEMNYLKTKIDEIVSINSFLSTSIDRDIALGFALASIDGRSDMDELNAVLFEIEADPSLAIHTPFANISGQSMHPDEEEYLFHLNSLFRVIAIEADHYVGNITIIRLVLTSLPRQQEDDMVHAARSMILDNTDDIGRVAINMVDSMRHFRLSNTDIMSRKLLKNIKNSNLPDKHAIFIKNGDEAISYRRYTVAIEFYREALLINPSNARTWTQIAKSHHNLSDHKQAILACHRAIDLNSINGSLPSAYCHYLIGMSLSETGETKSALLELEKTINIVNSMELLEKEVISDEDRGSPRLDDITRAFHKYTQSGKKLELLVIVYEQMGIAYEALGESQKALIWFQNALDIFRTIETNFAQITRIEKRILYNMSNVPQ
jgi:hypothetical protein